VLIVVGVDTDRAHPATVGASLFPAVQNLLLASTALGLGSVLTTLAVSSMSGSSDELASLVGFPSTVTPVAVVPLGWPEHRLRPARRRPLSEVAHRETYGTTW
jgi:nitroreductase